MSDLTVACIGAGYFSQFHIAAWRALPGVRPIAAIDTDRAKAAATGLPPFTAPAEALQTLRPDIVDIVTPPHTHAAMVGLALAAGARAVICQKPFCQSVREARATAAAAASLGVPLIVHDNFRFQPWYRAIHRAMDHGAVGAVHQVSFRFRPGDGQGPDAYLDRQPYFQTLERFLIRETAVHWIDVFRYLLGPAEAVFADLRRLNPAIAGEDAGTVLFFYPNECRALFDGNRHLDHAADNPRWTMGEALVEGTAGTLALSGDGRVTLRRFGAREVTEILAPTRAEGFGGGCVAALQAHVVAGLRDGTPFENRAEDYLYVLEAERAIYRSADTGQVERIEFP